MDGALQSLYGDSSSGQNADRRGGLGSSAPNVARWLGDIRHFFPTSVVQVMQKDAIERLNLRQLLFEPELVDSLVPDVHLASTILSLAQVMPTETRATARLVVDRMVQDLMRRLSSPLRQAVGGKLNRSARTKRPRFHEIDWHRTIRANLKHYQAEYRTIVPETRIGYAKRRPALRDVILCLDQSGSMAESVVYAGVFGAVLASMPTLRTQVIAFDTAVVDLTEDLTDPVELLFGVQLGGGTDINRALTYCQNVITRPTQTILVLISDLYEGGNANEMLARAGQIVGSGVQMIALLALSDSGAPSFDKGIASHFASMGIPAFACTPDLFPGMMAAAIERRDISGWAASEGIVTARGQAE
ncbi:MAG: VWA domain-containing protein [Anaerolineae bacterium]